MPRITVGILTYNRREAVLKAIQSAFDQHFADMEVVVVDSNSQDGTAEAVREQFPEVKVICLPRNLGCPGGRNHVYANAMAEYIVNLDDDGWLGERALERIEETFESDPSIGIVCMRQCFLEEENSAGKEDDDSVTEVGSFRGGVSAFRRKMLEEIGVYPEDFFFFKEEEFLTLRAINAGYKIVAQPNIIMWHPRYGSSGSIDVRWDYYRFRNPLLVVVRLFPGWLMVKYLVLRIGSYTLISLRRGTFHNFLAAVCGVLWQMPKTLLNRDACEPDAVRKYFRRRCVDGHFQSAIRGERL